MVAARRNEPLESHRSHSNRFLVHADEMIRKGDRLQASEKIWGAVAHALKAVANERGWERDGHQRLRNVALHLQDHPAVANPEIGTLLRSVEAFHRNFYNDNMAIDEIASGLVDAANLVRLLEAANAALPGDAPGPRAPASPVVPSNAGTPIPLSLQGERTPRSGGRGYWSRGARSAERTKRGRGAFAPRPPTSPGPVIPA